MNQTTIQRVVTCSGIGLHSGNKVYLALRPASANTGIIFDIDTPDGIRRVRPGHTYHLQHAGHTKIF